MNNITDSYNLDSIAKGDRLPVDAFTNYDQLSEIIRKYNSIVEDTNPDLKVDTSVVDIRHAIAHGRALSSAKTLPLKLFKFSRPDNRTSTVKVTHCVSMTKDWFREKITLVLDQLKKVGEANSRFGQKEGS